MDGEEAAGREDGGGRDRGVAESGKGGKGGERRWVGFRGEEDVHHREKKCTHILPDETRLELIADC